MGAANTRRESQICVEGMARPARQTVRETGGKPMPVRPAEAGAPSMERRICGHAWQRTIVDSPPAFDVLEQANALRHSIRVFLDHLNSVDQKTIPAPMSKGPTSLCSAVAHSRWSAFCGHVFGIFQPLE